MVAQRLELQGDLWPLKPGDLSSPRLHYHLAGFIVELFALGCFLFAAYKLYRYFRPKAGDDEEPRKAPPRLPPSAPEVSPSDAYGANPGASFDPDAALKRYMDRRARESGTVESPAAARADRDVPEAPPPPPAPRGFGRKGL